MKIIKLFAQYRAQVEKGQENLKMLGFGHLRFANTSERVEAIYKILPQEAKQKVLNPLYDIKEGLEISSKIFKGFKPQLQQYITTHKFLSSWQKLAGF